MCECVVEVTEHKQPREFKLDVDFSDLHRCVEQMGAVELEEEFSVQDCKKEAKVDGMKYLYTMPPVDEKSHDENN